MELILKYFPDLSEEQKRQFAALYDLYGDWNAKINVVSRKDFDQLYLRHVLHSLAIAKVCRFEAGAEVLGVVSIFTYGMKKGLERLAAANVTNYSLSNFDTLVEVAVEQGYIAADDEARLKRFMANPQDESWMQK